MKRIDRFLLAALLMLPFVTPFSAQASEVPLFHTEKEAARHCPDSVVVWVDTDTGIYHLKGERWYGGAPRHGAFVCKSEADNSPHMRHGYQIDD